MLEFKPISLNDKEIFDKYLKPYTFKTCEYSFTNLFIWRKGCEIQYTIYNDALIIIKTDFEGNRHFMQPIGFTNENIKDIVSELKEYKDKHNLNFLFKDVEQDFLDLMKNLYKDNFSYEEDRDNFDYIFESSKLSSLSGKKLHSKKNHFNNFTKNNKYRTSPITDEMICECIKTAREWCNKNDCKGYLLYELRAIEELLKNSRRLDFKSMAVYVDDKLSAFTIGEKMNDDMAIIHIEKADAEINGLYAYINKTFIEEYFKDVPYINREQDLGIEGLRKSKLSYQPERLEPKYKIY